MTASAPPSYAGHRFPAEIISHTVWLYFRFPLSRECQKPGALCRELDCLLAEAEAPVQHCGPDL